MSGHSSYEPSTGLEKWIDSRLPLPRLVYDSFVAYPVPRNLNYAYTFGAMLSVQVRGGEAEAMAAVGRCRLFTRATSLGGVESLIEHRKSNEAPDSMTPDNLL